MSDLMDTYELEEWRERAFAAEAALVDAQNDLAAATARAEAAEAERDQLRRDLSDEVGHKDVIYAALMVTKTRAEAATARAEAAEAQLARRDAAEARFGDALERMLNEQEVEW